MFRNDNLICISICLLTYYTVNLRLTFYGYKNIYAVYYFSQSTVNRFSFEPFTDRLAKCPTYSHLLGICNNKNVISY